MLRKCKAARQALSIATLSGIMCLGAGLAHADVGCTESITALIVHTDGYVYFETSKTCQSWCQLNFSTAAANNNGYAMLLAAKTTGVSVTFDWPNIASCSTLNATYASPAYMYF